MSKDLHRIPWRNAERLEQRGGGVPQVVGGYRGMGSADCAARSEPDMRVTIDHSPAELQLATQDGMAEQLQAVHPYC